MTSLRTFADADRNTIAKVQEDVRADYNKQFARGGTVFFQRLPAFTVCFPSVDTQQYPPGFLDYVSANLTDRFAKETLERDFKCLNWESECTHLIPLYTTGDGNCLLHAASLAMWGIEDKQFILRNALYNSLITATPDSNTLQDRCRQSVGEVLRGVNVNLSDRDWEGEWRTIVNQATPNTSGYYQSLEESHIFVLANIIRRPIIVYGVPKVRSCNDGVGTMQNINFHGIYLPLLWGSQLCHKAPLCLAYSTGHFTALVPVITPRKQSIVPIVDNTGRELPIRFLLQAEQQNTFYLLQQYLDVIQQYSATLRRQVSVAVLVIREATHVPQLVSNYINVAYTEFTKQNQSYYTPNQPGAAPSQSGEVHRQPCIGCDSGVYASAETNFLCSVCYRKHRSAAANYSGGLKCRSPGCQEQGLTSKDGYCNNHYTRNPQGGNEQFYSNNFNQVDRNSTQNPPPAGGSEQGDRPKCKQCKDFFANEELNGLCSGCFKAKSIKESNEKPPSPQQQFIPPPTPIQNANNAEPPADKCYKCQQFHGDEQWGGLCSVCFKEKSKEEANAKPPAQVRNNFQHPGPPNQQAWSNPQLHGQQPAYTQARVNPQPPPPNPQRAANPFGPQCMTQGCARFADDNCQGYCPQCFASSVERFQHQQQQLNEYQQQPHQYDRMRQQEEYERKEFEHEQARRRQEINRQEEIRKQEEARQLEFKRQQQYERQHEPTYQQMQVQTTDFSRPLEHQSQQQNSTHQKEPSTNYATTTFLGLCKNHMCSKYADPNCDGYCAECLPSHNQTPAQNATQGQMAPSHNASLTQGKIAQSPNVSPTQGRSAPPSNPSSTQQIPPPIKPRKNVPKTAPKALISEEPGYQTSRITDSMPVTSSSCFMCAKIKPTTVDFTYNLCHKHAARIAASFDDNGLESPQVTTKPSMQQETATNPGTHPSYNPMSGTTGVQQRRGSAFDDQQQQLQTNRYSAEQKMVHHSREQYPTGPSMTHRSGEQSYISPGPQSAYNSGQSTGYPAASHQNQQPMGALSHLSGEQSNRYNDNSGSQSRGQVGPPMNTNAPYPSGTQSGNQFSSQSGSHQPYNTGDQFTSHHPMQNAAPYHSSGDQLFSAISQVHPQSKNAGYNSQEMQGNNNFSTGPYGDNRNPGDIKYPPTSTGGQSQYNSSSSQHSSVSSNQYNGHSHHSQYGPNDQSQYQQQSHQQHYQGQQQYQGHQQQSSYPKSQQHQVGGHQAASGRPSQGNLIYNSPQASGYRGSVGASGEQFPPHKDHQQQSSYYQSVGGHQAASGRPLPGDRNHNTPQAGSYGESAGASGQQFRPSKPTINTLADTDVVHSGGDMPHAKMLCRTPGCSFYAKATLENYCDDCYEKSGLKNYKICQNPTCRNHVAGTVAKLCESCLLASK